MLGVRSLLVFGKHERLVAKLLLMCKDVDHATMECVAPACAIHFT